MPTIDNPQEIVKEIRITRRPVPTATSLALTSDFFNRSLKSPDVRRQN